MKNLKKSELDKIYSNNKNLTDKPIFIDFYADWWGPCKVFNSVLDDVTPEYQNQINMYKVNIEEEPEIAGLFGVRSIPTMSMIRVNGERLSFVGALDKSTLKYYFDGLI